MRKVQDFNLLYYIFAPYIKYTFLNFYGKVEVEGMEHLPKDQPYIIAPNHQNALMDALSILTVIQKPVVFLARSDIFKNTRTAGILHFLKMMPVYRIRDGYDQLGRNEETFIKSIDVLKDDIPLCLMPEGAQSEKRSLLPFVKGMFRIAFMSQEKLQQKDLLIIPAGIDYGDYIHPGKPLIIRFGPGLPVKKYLDLYHQNNALGLNAIRKDLWNSLSTLVQNIRSQEFYQEFYAISLMASAGQPILAGLKIRQNISRQLDTLSQEKPEELVALKGQYTEYNALLNSAKLKDETLAAKPGWGNTILNTLGILLALPLFLAGGLGNILPWLCSQPMLRNVKEIGFYSSFSYVLWLVFYSVYYVILLLVTGFVAGWCLAPLVLLLPPTGYVAFKCGQWIQKNRQQWRYLFTDSSVLQPTQTLRSTILERFRDI